MPQETPFISLAGDATGAVLRNNLPEPTSYEISNIAQYDVPASQLKTLTGSEQGLVKGTPPAVYNDELLNSVKNNMVMVPGLQVKKKATMPAATARTVAPADDALLKANMQEGKVPYVKTLSTGKQVVEYRPPAKSIQPGLYIILESKMTNFLGDYGAGRVIQTFTLLPGEKTEVYLKTYKNQSSTVTETQSIFDSYSETAEEEFSNSLESECANTTNTDFKFETKASVKASVGVVSGEAEMGASYEKAVENTVSNISNVSSKHASQVSSKRDVQVNTSAEFTSSSGEENSIKRIIENVNTDRVLNFVFRQMNQEFYSVLHIVDVKFAFYNGYDDKTKVVPFDRIDELLTYCVTDPNNFKKIKSGMMNCLMQLKNHDGTPVKDFIIKKNEEYALNKKIITPVPGTAFSVEGPVIKISKVVMRTDGVIVDALLGLSPALTELSLFDKTESINTKKRNNEAVALNNQLLQVFIDAVKNNNKEMAELVINYQKAMQPDTAS